VARLPSVLEDINAFFGDESYAGLCNTMTLPKVVVKTVDQTLSGFAGDVERSLGKLEKLESEVTISSFATKVMGLVGSRSSRDEVFVVRGAVDVGGTISTVIVRQSGLWKSLELNEFKTETEVSTKFAIAVEYFELEINGAEVIYIDKLNNVFRMNGVDRNEEVREALAQ
jgi:P2 family phage contractile tail tube protein